MANKNPDMSGLKHFPPGKSGNPGGKTSEHRRAEVEAAEIAAKIQLNMVKALAGAVEAGSESALEAIRSDVLRLIKDAQDRGFGAPMQPVEQTGNMTVNIIGDDAKL